MCNKTQNQQSSMNTSTINAYDKCDKLLPTQETHAGWDWAEVYSNGHLQSLCTGIMLKQKHFVGYGLGCRSWDSGSS